DSVNAFHQVVDADLLFKSVIRTVERSLSIARQIQHGLAKRFAGDGSGVQRHAADHLPTVNDRHAFAELGRGDRAPLADRAAADDGEIKAIKACGHELSYLPSVPVGA